MDKISSLWFLCCLGFILFFTSCNLTIKTELLPVLTTSEISAIAQTTARTGGVITSDAGASVTARGVCWSTKANPTVADSKTSDGTGIGSFTSSITGLSAQTSYYVRAYATTSAGTGYGVEHQFTTLVATPTISDVDGNVYHAITIGTQTWMVENLKTTKYNDGTTIPNVTDNAIWATLTTAACCWYNNDRTNKDTYGALYNWYAVNTGKLAPAGWHVATDAEWTILENYTIVNLGISGSVAKALAANTNWAMSTNTTAIGNDLTKNNSSGFSALPDGYRGSDGISDGTFGGLDGTGCWQTATEYGTSSNWSRGMLYYSRNVERYYSEKWAGLSVRCVRD